MTPEQKEIRDAERKALAEVRAWKRKASKAWKDLPHEERMEFFKKEAERIRALGFKVVETVTTNDL